MDIISLINNNIILKKMMYLKIFNHKSRMSGCHTLKMDIMSTKGLTNDDLKALIALKEIEQAEKTMKNEKKTSNLPESDKKKKEKKEMKKAAKVKENQKKQKKESQDKKAKDKLECIQKDFNNNE